MYHLLECECHVYTRRRLRGGGSPEPFEPFEPSVNISCCRYCLTIVLQLMAPLSINCTSGSQGPTNVNINCARNASNIKSRLRSGKSDQRYDDTTALDFVQISHVVNFIDVRI